MIDGPINDTGIEKTRYNNKLYTLYVELDIVTVIKIRRLRWMGQLFRMQEMDRCRVLTVLKPKAPDV